MFEKTTKITFEKTLSSIISQKKIQILNTGTFRLNSETILQYLKIIMYTEYQYFYFVLVNALLSLDLCKELDLSYFSF